MKPLPLLKIPCLLGDKRMSYLLVVGDSPYTIDTIMADRFGWPLPNEYPFDTIVTTRLKSKVLDMYRVLETRQVPKVPDGFFGWTDEEGAPL